MTARPQRDRDRDLLARLLATEPVTDRANRAIVDLLVEHLDRPGIRVQRHPAGGEDRWNLVAFTGPPVGPGREGLVLSGHLDVVPPGDGWTSPAFTLTDRDGLWYGRGACDMLGFVAMAANLLVRAAAEGVDRPLVLILTADEEIGSRGAAALAASWPADERLPRDAVVGEPTGLQVVRLHKGHAKRRFVLHGTSAHSGTPALGRSAVEAAGPVLTRLAALRRDLQSEGGPEAACFTSAPFPVLTVGRVRGGVAVNVVPESCTLDLGVRVMPGQRSEDLMDRVRAAVEAGMAEAAAASEGGDVPAISMTETDLGDNPPLGTPRDAAIVSRLMRITGQDEDLGVSFASDGGHLAGGLGMEPVLFGPGHMRVAHRPDEHLDPAELDAARGVLEALIGLAVTSGPSSEPAR